jgi:hypothetical protein
MKSMLILALLGCGTCWSQTSADCIPSPETHRNSLIVGGGEKGYQFGGRKGTTCAVTLWPILLVLRLHYRRLFCGKPVAPVTGRCVQ